jgi:hypothetical protein
MNAGVGTTGADDRRRLTDDLLDCPLELALYRRPTSLALEAREVGAVVLQP